MNGEASRTLDSAVVILMPDSVAAFTAAYRQSCGAEVFYPVVPHITLMWPFVSPGTVADGVDVDLLANLVDRLRAICRLSAPFELILDHYDGFPGVLYLAPRNPALILALHYRILVEFPAYVPYGGQYGDLKPHMTLAIFPDEQAFAVAPRPAFEPFQFVVSEVCLMVGDLEAKLPWELAAVIPLGGKI